jgi:hypothetical protein
MFVTVSQPLPPTVNSGAYFINVFSIVIYMATQLASVFITYTLDFMVG